MLNSYSLSTHWARVRHGHPFFDALAAKSVLAFVECKVTRFYKTNWAFTKFREIQYKVHGTTSECPFSGPKFNCGAKVAPRPLPDVLSPCVKEE
jgi:hypothetical protein